MNRLRPGLIALGAVLELMGLLWIGQGLGYVRWPATSFMIDQMLWVEIGAAILVVGIFLMWRGLKRPA